MATFRLKAGQEEITDEDGESKTIKIGETFDTNDEDAIARYDAEPARYERVHKSGPARERPPEQKLTTTQQTEEQTKQQPQPLSQQEIKQQSQPPQQPQQETKRRS